MDVVVLMYWRPTSLRRLTYRAQYIENDLFHAHDYPWWFGGAGPGIQ